MGRLKTKKLLHILWATFLAFVVNTDKVYATSSSPGVQPLEIEQSISRVTGTVVDKNKEPLIGVTISLQGTKTQTITNVDGKYSIAISGDKPVLIFSYVGFKQYSIEVKNSVIDVTLEEDSKILSEIVVVGYGTMKKENLTGAVFSVDVNSTLENRPIADVGRGLQGVVPGLNIVLPNSEIGSDPMMKIRGNIGSIQGSSSPLILLDNVEIPSIQLVNPEDIESISVLKDAASTSIYGAKAAFGVILITSKKGSKDQKISVQYSNNFGFQTIGKDVEMAGIDGLRYAVESAERVGSPYIGAFFKVDRNSIARTEEWLSKYGNKLDFNDPMYYGRDWYREGGFNYGVRLYNAADYMIKEVSPSQTHNLSVSGTTNTTTYNLSVGYLKQESMLKPAKKDDYQRYNMSLRINSEINKFLTVRASMLYSNRNKRSPYASTYSFDPWYYMYRWSPIMPWGVDEYGDPLRTPAHDMASANTATRENSYISANVGATVNITPNWNVVADYTYARNDAVTTLPGTRYQARNLYIAPTARVDAFGNYVYVNQDGQQVPEDPTDPTISMAYDFLWQTYQVSGSDLYQRTSGANRDGVLNIYSTYELKWGNKYINTMKFMAGINRVTNDYDSNWSQITNVFDPQNPQINQALGVQTTGGSSRWEAQLGYFGRINYDFANKYLLEANIRYDGTSKFPKHMSWEWFPSFSAGWIVSEEEFMKNLNPVLSFFKMRASWGAIGDQTVASNLYLETMPKRELSWIDGTGKKVNTFSSPKFVQKDIGWQRIETLDFGIDMYLFNNKLNLTADWYQRKTKDMITTGATIPLVVGAASPMGNYAELTTKGWEVSLSFQHRFKNGLGINATAAFYDSKSVYTDFYDDNQKSIWGYYKGKTYGEIWGYTTDRLFQKGDFVYDNSGNIATTVIDGKTTNVQVGNAWSEQTYLEGSGFIFGPGDVKYKDLDKNGKIHPGTAMIDDHGDLSIIGNSTPRYEYSFRLGADYQGFDISVFFQGIGKRNLWGEGPLAIPGYQIGDGAIPQAIAGDYWTEENTNAFYPRPWNMYTNNTGYNMQTQTKYLLDMSYLRIKNVTLGYTFNQEWLKKAYMNQARIYLSIENLHTFDNLRGLPIDPEVITGNSMFTSDNSYNSGRTGVGAPAFRIFSFGMQLNF